MRAGTVQSIGIGTLEKPLVRGTVSSRYDIARLEKVARANPKGLPGIQVGIIDGKCYPMGRFDVLAAYRAASIHEIKADVQNYDSKLDLMTDQIREISVGEYLDPLHIRDVIDEFGRCGIKAGDMLERVNLAGTSAAKVATSMITDRVLETLADFIDTELSEKLPAASLVIPTHILTRMARMDPEMQGIIADKMIELTIPQTEVNFSWPTPLALAYEIRNTTKPEEESKAVVVGTVKNTKIPQRHAETIEDLQKTSKDCMIVVDKRGKPKMIVDKKNNTVKEISHVDGGRAFKLGADAAKPAYMIPFKTEKHLALDSRPLQGRDFDDVDLFVEFCQTLKGSGLRMSVFWTTQ